MTNILQVFEAEMEVATGGQNEPAFETSLKFIPALPYQFGNETMVGTRVWSADDVGYAVLDRHFGHAASDFERRGAIIEARKYVAMNVNHQWGRITQAERDDNADDEERELNVLQPIGPPFA